MPKKPIVFRLTQEKICLRCSNNDVQLCRLVPGWEWNPSWCCWTFPRTQATARRLMDLFATRIEAADGGAEIVSMAGHDGPALTPQDCTEDPGHGVIVGLKKELWKHQRLAHAFAINKTAALFHMYMGTGKTLLTLSILANRGRRHLVVCPKAVIPVWPKEVNKRVIDGESWVVATLDKGTSMDKARALEAAIERADGSAAPLLVVVNYETVWRDAVREMLRRYVWDNVIYDESHKIKNPNGKASKFAHGMRKKARHVLLLSGTPMPHSPLDIFSQFKAAAPTIFGENFTAFRRRYAVIGPHGASHVVGFQRLDELRERILPITFQASKDCLDLPEQMTEVVEVELSALAKKTYSQLATRFYAEVENDEITAANALVKLLRLQQITGGFVPNDAGAMVEIDTSKREALFDLIEGMGDEPVVVFCRFSADIDSVRIVCDQLSGDGRRVGFRELSGRENQLHDWQEGGGQVLGVNIRSGGAGIDLTRARYCIFYSVGFSLGDFEQAINRVHRPGQGRPVTYYHLVAKKTVDEDVYAALEKRANVVEYVMKLKQATIKEG